MHLVIAYPDPKDVSNCAYPTMSKSRTPRCTRLTLGHQRLRCPFSQRLDLATSGFLGSVNGIESVQITGDSRMVEKYYIEGIDSERKEV